MTTTERTRGNRRQSVQTVSWFRDLYTRGLLVLDPPYQRRSVWNQAFKDYFIDTVLLGFPAPAIFLYEEISPDGVSKYNVVDGKQRLLTIFDFVDGAFPVADGAAMERLRGRYFRDFADDDKTTFWTYQFSVEYLPTNEEELLSSVFDRINRNVAKLTPQELRHAAYSGEFVSSAEDLTQWMAEQLPPDFPRVSPAARKQMRDVELVAQLLLAADRGPEGYSQSALDTVTAERDTEWVERSDVEARFRAAVAAMRPVAVAIGGNNHRLKNQADFYSWFAAVAEMLRANEALPEAGVALQRLDDFFARVADEQVSEQGSVAREYYEAARSNSNDTAQRRTRTQILRTVLCGT